MTVYQAFKSYSKKRLIRASCSYQSRFPSLQNVCSARPSLSVLARLHMVFGLPVFPLILAHCSFKVVFNSRFCDDLPALSRRSVSRHQSRSISPDAIQLEEKLTSFSSTAPFDHLEVITTLGVGGFGRVELVHTLSPSP